MRGEKGDPGPKGVIGSIVSNGSFFIKSAQNARNSVQRSLDERMQISNLALWVVMVVT